MKKIINLTQHLATNEQVNEGVVEPENKQHIKELLTFEEPPSADEICDRAEEIACYARGYKAAMIGGAGFLISALEDELNCRGVKILHSFSQRVVVERVLCDGTVKKVSTFKHLKFIDPYGYDAQEVE